MPSPVKGAPVKKGKNVKKEIKQEIKPEIKSERPYTPTPAGKRVRFSPLRCLFGNVPA
jgi:hypothetical protein